MSAQTEYVTLSVSDGTSMRAYVARPASKPRAGLIVFQEAFGVNAHIRDVAERFAGQGYLAIAPELFHRTAPGFEGSYTDFPAVMPHMKALSDNGLAADGRAAFDWLENQARGLPAGAIGYCMGGRTACLAAITTPLACAVSYYGGGIAPSPMFPNLLDRLKDLKAPMLLFWGGKDAHIGPEAVDAVTGALRSASKPYVNVVFSDADHGFFCDARASYNPQAAAQAWPLTLAFLETHLASVSRHVGA
ncbi:MAG TPA: dienelactone hydrolase family protein [Bryobacteraceae bacterium]|nr:dienelactone hydrolase family protein [Bryobacteraceae bacterium]